MQPGTYRIRVQQDEDASNPRKEHENAGTMACWHGRYNLGDVQPKDGPGLYRERLVLDLGLNAFDNPPCTCHADDSRQVDQVDPTGDTCYRCGGSFAERDKARDLFNEHFIELPLYLYDHSGLTISTGAFACQWDSGQVGFIFIPLADAELEWPTDTIERAVACMKGEVETYDQFLRGDVYGFEIERGEPYVDTRTFPHLGESREDEGFEWEHEDSCWGFYGSDPDENGMSSHVDDAFAEALSRAADDIGEWIEVTIP